MDYHLYSDRLLTNSINRYHLSMDVAEAFGACPRHLFVDGDYSIEEKYKDYPLSIYHDEKFESTISQPSFVLLMLDMLDLEPGQKVLELGAGSGWNAALMSHLVGASGKVISIEIIPHLAQETRTKLAHMGYRNVKIIEGNGVHGYLPEAPYDRAVFTAGASDLPQAFHEQVSEGGKLLFVLQTLHRGDLLILLQKHKDHFESLSQLPCQFVPLKGDVAQTNSSQMDHLVGDPKIIRIYPRTNYPFCPPGQQMVVKQDSVFFF